MEATSTDTDMPNISQSPPKRRRSTFFERRDSIILQENVDILNDDDKKYFIYMTKYHDDLLREKDLWKAEVKERRSNYHILRKQFNTANNLNTRKCNYSVLTDEDLQFLNGKVNIAKVAESALDLHKAATLTMHKMRRLKALHEAVLDQCESRVDAVSQYILEHSVIKE